MARFTWWDLIRREIPVDMHVNVYCSCRVQDALVRALEKLDYAVLEARIKTDPRWFYLVNIEYQLFQAIAMCDEELAEEIKGKTPEELQDMKYQLMIKLRKRWLIGRG